MLNMKHFVLPFEWNEFGDWFSKIEKDYWSKSQVQLRINDVCFESFKKKLSGIRLKVSLEALSKMDAEIVLCPFLVDMKRKILFKPFSDQKACYYYKNVLAARAFLGKDSLSVDTELFLPEQGWVLPSIWKKMRNSLGLNKKVKHPSFPHLLVLGFNSVDSVPICFAQREFDYFRESAKLREKLVLKDFFELVGMKDTSDIRKIEIAFKKKLFELKSQLNNCQTAEIGKYYRRSFEKLQLGYSLWLNYLKR